MQFAQARNEPYKIPRSALVVIHTARQEVLLIERADHPGYWQSVTGSQDEGEALVQTAVREVRDDRERLFLHDRLAGTRLILV